jgi:hypothetical protein
MSSPRFRRVIGEARGRQPGPTLLLVAGQHGNEPGGVLAAERVLAQLTTLGIELRGELVALAGNVKALERGVRQLDHDLNRRWSDADVERIRRQPPSADDAEDAEHRALLAEIESVITRARGEVFVLDLHTTSAAGTPFVLFGDTLRQRTFGAHFPLPILLGLEEQLDGVLSQRLTRRGCITLAIEGGQHADPKSIDALEACIWVALEAAGLASRQHLSPWGPAHRLLTELRGALPHFVEVVHRHAIGPGDAFVMEPGFSNLAPARRGQLLARDVHGEILAEDDGVVMLPLYQKHGDDGFFWGRPLSRTSLVVGSALRRLGVDRLLPLLPGVHRDGEALAIDPQARERYPSALFHGLGYRRERKRGDRLQISRAPD